MAKDRPIAIIGNGCAAAECVVELRRRGYSGQILMFADNTHPIANPMLTTYHASGKIPYEAQFPYGLDFYSNYRVDFHGGEPVERLCAGDKTLHTASGVTYGYEKCLIASGAAAVRPPIPGIDLPQVLTVRTVADSVRLHQAACSEAAQVLVVGASMVGIKVVEMFLRRQVTVTLADMAPHVFPLAASEGCARRIETRLEHAGVRLKLAAQLSRIEQAPECGVNAYFAGEEDAVRCDILAMCVGVRANLGFIDRSEVVMERGVLVDEYLRTSADGLYAAGDVAQGRNLLSGQRQIIGLLASAREQGRAAGRHMAGVPEGYPGGILHNITHFMGMDFVGIGDVNQYDHITEEEDECSFRQYFWRNGSLCALNTLNDYESSGVLKRAVMKSRVCPPVSGGAFSDWLRLLPQLELLEQIGWKEWKQ